MIKISYLSSINCVFGIEKNWTENFLKTKLKYYIKMKIPKKNKDYRTVYQAREP